MTEQGDAGFWKALIEELGRGCRDRVLIEKGWRRLRAYIWAALRGEGRDSEAIRDACDHAWLVVAMKLKDCTDHSTFLPWAVAIARNSANKEFTRRAARRRRELPFDERAFEATSPEKPPYARLESEDECAVAIRRQSPRSARLLQGWYEGERAGANDEAVANRLGLTLSSYRSMRSRARGG